MKNIYSRGNDVKLTQNILCMIFCLYFLSEIFFSHTIISQACLFIFIGLVTLITLCGNFKWSSFLTFYVLFLICSGLNIFLGKAVNVDLATDMTITVFLCCIFFFCFVNFCYYINSYELIKKLIKNCSVFVCIVALVVNIVVGGDRLSGIGVNANTVAMLGAYTSIFIINDLINKKGNTKLNLLVLLIIVITIIFSGSRKGLIIPCVGLYILTCFRKPKKFIIITMSVIALVIVGYILLLKIDFLYDLIGNRVEQAVFFVFGEDVTEGSLISRSDFFNLAWKESQDSLILGHGLAAFSLLPNAYGVYSHSNVMEIIYSLGFVGLVVFYLPFAIILLKSLKNIRIYGGKIAPFIAIIISFIVCDFFNVTYYNRVILMFPILSIVMIENIVKVSKVKSE